MRKERINEIWAVLFLLLGLFTLASLIFFHKEDIPFYTSNPASPVKNYTGIVGAYAAFGLLVSFGISSYMIPALFLLWSGCFFLQQVPEKKLFKFVGLGIALFSTSTLVAISIPSELRFDKGGAIGYVASAHLLHYFGLVGSYIVTASCLLLSLLLATDFLIYPLIRKSLKGVEEFVEDSDESTGSFQDWLSFIPFLKKAKRKARRRNVDEDNLEEGEEERGTRKTDKKQEKKLVPTLPQTPVKVKRYNPDAVEGAEDEGEEDPRVRLKQLAAKLKKDDKPSARTSDRDLGSGGGKAKEKEDEARYDKVIGSKPVTDGSYTFPPIDLLRIPVKGQVPKDNLQENSKILEETLAEFGIEVKVMEVEQGPVITRYELLPAAGVRVNSISALSDDIARSMKAASVRLIIPIPGKDTIGVEVPNSVTSTVFLREIIDSPNFKKRKQILPLALGKDTSGNVLLADLASMPHILIAGTTGSGKTVCVNSVIAGLLYALSPAELKFVMVDPKMVELASYNKIPHMLTPVVTDVRKAAHTLNWVVSEMENRYKLFATVGVRNIQAFNSRPLSEEAAQQTAEVQSENVVPARLPYIVVIIDELADLMMVAQDKVEGAITRLAQLSRAVGIHLILATQRPSVDVITGVIKANFPARISFKVASKVDSRTVIDAIGADKLLGRGDMLFMQPGDEKPTRGQAAYVIDEEINGLIKFVSEQAKPEFHPEIQAIQEGKTASGAGEKDELFDEAVSVVLETGQASTSNLQRRLRLGYTRAARIIDQMEAEGLVGPAQGAKPREIYIDRIRTREEPLEQSSSSS